MGFVVNEKPYQGGRESARVLCVRANNASAMTYTGTNSWIVAEPQASHCVVIDVAPAGQHVQDVLALCKQEGLEVGAVVCTHGHPDHTEGANELALLAGVRVFAPFDGTLVPGRFIPFEGSPEFQVVALPGHSSDSVGLVYPADKSLFVGDVVFNHGPTVVYFPDGNLADYLHSLDVLEQIVKKDGINTFYPGHGYPISDPLGIIEETRLHRLQRLEQIQAALDAGVERNANALVDAVYDGLDPALREPALRSVKAQLLYLDKV